MHDIVVRGGTVVDGTGRERFEADVAIDGAKISEVAKGVGQGRREIDARGMLVTPGWIDLHTHYDGQVSWDSELAPSSWHGVTSVLMGNCGVGFAPAKKSAHDWLIALMEGVEDIPESALAEGLTWKWESFTEYMDAVAAVPHSIDIGFQVPHAPLRAFVMGERGANHEIDPTPDEIEEMYRQVRDALLAGATGFASSRSTVHKSRDGSPIPSKSAGDPELLGIARALKDTGRGVIQYVGGDMDLLRRLAEGSGRPLSFTLLQTSDDPNRWRASLEFVQQAVADGVNIKGQVCLRPVGALLGLQATLNPFMLCPTYQKIAHLSLADRVAEMRKPEVRGRIVAEHAAMDRIQTTSYIAHSLDNIFKLGDPPNYEPNAEDAIFEQAKRTGANPADLVYDLLLERDGKELLYTPRANYSQFTLDPAREMALADNTFLALSDGGAHVGTICDASFPTFNITYWTKERTRGQRLPLEFVIQRQTSEPARHAGWSDRGVLAPGYKADVNVIDLDGLRLHPPYIRHDLPAGGKRLLQEADGYRATICSGAVTFEDGKSTGAMPGAVIRGAQPVPAA
jgi:N-acyl-D-aspartate/D-glutamate deacylase